MQHFNFRARGGPYGPFLESPETGHNSVVIILFVSSNLRCLKARNFEDILIFYSLYNI